MDQTVRLPEEKPEVFEWFLQWLYTGTLKTPVPRCNNISNGIPTGPNAPSMQHLSELTAYDLRSDGDLRNSQGSPKYFLLLDLYSLSDRLLTVQLSNHILSTIARLSESTNSVPTPSDTWILYDGIRENAPIRTLILDLFAYKKTDRLLETHKDEWHSKFLRELCVKLKRPGPEAIERHSLVAWRPENWSTTKACELCKEVMQPGISGDRCCACEKVFCKACLRNWGRMIMPNDTSGCKPWTGKGMCLRYHEHAEGEACVMFWV
jgi:poly(rC)-binding protein 2/3/4